MLRSAVRATFGPVDTPRENRCANSTSDCVPLHRFAPLWTTQRFVLCVPTCARPEPSYIAPLARRSTRTMANTLPEASVKYCEKHGQAFLLWLKDNTVECACNISFGPDEDKQRGVIDADTVIPSAVGATCPSACRSGGSRAGRCAVRPEQKCA